jgi:hypothetical protein
MSSWLMFQGIMSDGETSTLSSQDVLRLLGSMQTAVEATTSSAAPLLTKYVILVMHQYVVMPSNEQSAQR